MEVLNSSTSHFRVRFPSIPQVAGKNKSSAKFSITLSAETLLLEAEVLPLLHGPVSHFCALYPSPLQVIGKNKSSAKFSIPLYAETLLLEAEVRPLPSCVAAYDTSSALIAPPKLLPWGTAIVNTLPVCLTSVNGSIVYSACSAKNVIVVKADVTPEGMSLSKAS